MSHRADSSSAARARRLYVVRFPLADGRLLEDEVNTSSKKGAIRYVLRRHTEQSPIHGLQVQVQRVKRDKSRGVVSVHTVTREIVPAGDMMRRLGQATQSRWIIHDISERTRVVPDQHSDGEYSQDDERDD